jgi:hypothetical protein
MNDRAKISAFLSSPTDVVPEREAAEWVVQRLNGVYAAHFELVAKRWERYFYEANRGFQEAIAPMETFDIVVGILWKRIGSELPPDRFNRPDGTPYESDSLRDRDCPVCKPALWPPVRVRVQSRSTATGVVSSGWPVCRT